MKRLLAVALCLCLLLAGCGGTETGYTPTGNGLVWDEDYTGVATQPASAEGEDALELVRAGDVRVEYDKLIDRQLERAAITSISGFGKICDGAAKVLNV